MRWIIQFFKLLSPGSSGTTTRVGFWLKYTFAGAACVFSAGRLLFDRLWTQRDGIAGAWQCADCKGPGAAGVAMIHNIYVCAAHRGFREILNVICFERVVL